MRSSAASNPTTVGVAIELTGKADCVFRVSGSLQRSKKDVVVEGDFLVSLRREGSCDLSFSMS